MFDHASVAEHWVPSIAFDFVERRRQRQGRRGVSCNKLVCRVRTADAVASLPVSIPIWLCIVGLRSLTVAVGLRTGGHVALVWRARLRKAIGTGVPLNACPLLLKVDI